MSSDSKVNDAVHKSCRSEEHRFMRKATPLIVQMYVSFMSCIHFANTILGAIAAVTSVPGSIIVQISGTRRGFETRK